METVEIFNDENRAEPLVHITESKDKTVIMVDLPCVRKQNIDLKVSKKAVEINAIIKNTFAEDYFKKGVRWTFFHKIIDLPTETFPEKVKAKFEKNVLLITIPKNRKVKRIKIECWE